MVRLVRSIVLSVREEPYVEAAVTLGTDAETAVASCAAQHDRAHDRAGHLHLRARPF